MMSAKEFIVAKINQLKSKAYIAKFSVGDLIINTKYKILSQVLGVEMWKNPQTEKEEPYQYILKDLQHSLKTPEGIKRNKRFKPVHGIDAYYEKVEPQAAEILYGIKKDNK